MNKILIGSNVVLIAAVAILFYKVNKLDGDAPETGKEDITELNDSSKTANTVINSIATPPTGKIAFVNIDIINEQSEEVNDLVAEAKRSKASIEASVESLSIKYQNKVEEYQSAAKAGIRPQSDMEALAREIQNIERDAQNKQLQMDNLTMNINEKNIAFQQNLKEFLVNWNEGRFDYILTYSEAIPSMLLGNASLDVTKEVMEKVNADYKRRKEEVKSKTKKK
jgi:outer membrane protein